MKKNENDEQVSEQAVRQAAQQAGQTEGSIRSGVVDKEAAEVGMGERAKIDNANAGAMWRSNDKRTYDEYQHESLQAIRENRELTSRLSQNAVSHDETIQQLSTQALQNAVETANMIGKQAVAHRDIAIDNEWNPVQQGAGDTLTSRAVSIDDASLKAIGATVATALAQALSAKPAK